MFNKPKVIVKRNVDGWKAYFESNPKMWEGGNSATEALGELVLAHPDKFGIKLELILERVLPNLPDGESYAG